MDLFESLNETPYNRLPYDGAVFYHGVIVSEAIAEGFYQKLLDQIAWQNDAAMVRGKKIITKRKTAWYADRPFSYTYSGITRSALPWTPLLDELKAQVQRESGETYNSCLLNLYHDGSEGMGWHSDAEGELKKEGAIGSLSLGACRKFMFKHKRSKETVSIMLEPGSLLVMKGSTQTHWLHRLPPTKRVQTPRINLTFRTIANV